MPTVQEGRLTLGEGGRANVLGIPLHLYRFLNLPVKKKSRLAHRTEAPENTQARRASRRGKNEPEASEDPSAES
jgi:hypothetical protein